MRHVALAVIVAFWPFAAWASDQGWVDPHSALPRREIAIVTTTGAHPVTVEVASSEGDRDFGLSARNKVPDGTGMLYDFGEDRDVGMWMKGNLVPLDMVFVRADGQVADVRPGNAPGDLTPVRSPIPVRFVIEMPAGSAAAMGVRRLDKVDLAYVAGPPLAPPPVDPGAGPDGEEVDSR